VHDLEMSDTTRQEGSWEATVVELLEPDERDVAVLVAVGDGLLGDADLAALTGEPDDVVIELLTLLEHTGLVRRDAHGVPAPAHDLVRHAILDTLSVSQRRELHGRIARHLDARGDCPSVIAAHIEAAGDAALCRRGLVLALDACHQSLVLREVEAALSHLRCAGRLLQLLDPSP
jgi:predicted ATPase